MKKFLLSGLILVVFIAGCNIRDRVNAEHSRLLYKGQMVHPFQVGKVADYFVPDYLVGVPSVNTVDLSSADSKEPIKWQYGSWFSDRAQEGPDESFGYRRLGQLANGAEVVEAGYSGGGSGYFMVLLLVNFSEVNNRAVMTVLKRVRLGDRYDGRIEVLPDRVIISASKSSWRGNGSLDHEVVVRADVELVNLDIIDSEE